MNTTPSPAIEAVELPVKLEPGSPEHFALLGVPYGWNFLTGKDYADMQGFAKAVWDAALKTTGTTDRRHDEFDLMLSTLRYIVGAEPAAAGTTARDHYNAVVKALGAWPSHPEHAAKRIDAMLEKFPEMSPVAPSGEPVAWVLFRRDDDGLEPIQLYGGAEKPSGEFKDRFELRPVYFAAKQEEVDKMREALKLVINATHSHVDGRDLLAELHPRNMLDIKRRVDGVETWFEGDWLSNLWLAVKHARAALSPSQQGEPK